LVGIDEGKTCPVELERGETCFGGLVGSGEIRLGKVRLIWREGVWQTGSYGELTMADWHMGK